jgi:hypothetical protein
MRKTIAVKLGLALIVSAWGLAGAVESKVQPQAAAPPAAAPPAAPAAAGEPIVKDTASRAPDLAAERKAREEAARKAQELARTRRTLASPRPSFEFENASVKDVLAYMGEVGKFSVVYDNALQEAGIDLSARTVTIRLSRMTYEAALDLILPKEVGYRIEAGYVLVTTLEKSWLPLKTSIYSVQLAMAEIPNFTTAPRFEVANVLAAATAGGGAGAGLFTAPAQPQETGLATPERIIELIKKFAKNQSDRRIALWDDEGGPATIQYLGGRLIVSQTEQGHRAVAKILAMIE